MSSNEYDITTLAGNLQRPYDVCDRNVFILMMYTEKEKKAEVVI